MGGGPLAVPGGCKVRRWDPSFDATRVHNLRMCNEHGTADGTLGVCRERRKGGGCGRDGDGDFSAERVHARANARQWTCHDRQHHQRPRRRLRPFDRGYEGHRFRGRGDGGRGRDGSMADAWHHAGCILAPLVLAVGVSALATGTVSALDAAALILVMVLSHWVRRISGGGRQRVAWEATIVGGRRRTRCRKVETGANYIMIRGRPDGRLRVTGRSGLHVAELRRGGRVVLAVRSIERPPKTACMVARCVLSLALLTQPYALAASAPSNDGLTAAAACTQRHGHLRVGEAGTPGPAAATPAAAATGAGAAGRQPSVVWRHGHNASPLVYPMPGKVGFHGCHSAGFADDAPPPSDLFEFKAVTVNSTGWQPLARFLCTTDAHLGFRSGT